MFDGNPYLENPEIAYIFAFLLESNEARRVVGQNTDLRELIMRPVDTDGIQSQIQALEDEKREIDNQLDQLDALGTELPELEERRMAIKDELGTITAERAELEAEIEAFDINLEET